MIFAYLRVSTDDKQDFERQNYILKNSGYDIDERNIYYDKKSGKSLDRENYQILKKIVRTEDIIVFTELSRFSRNYNEISNEMTYFKNLGVKLVFLDMPFLSDKDDLSSELIYDITIKLFSYVAQVERENTNKRIKQKLDALKDAGVKLGRPSISLDNQQKELLLQYINKVNNITAKETAQKMGINYNTFFKILRTYKNNYLNN